MILSEKKLQEMIHKKVTPLTQTTDYDPGPALPGSPPRVLQGFLNKKQLSEQEQQQLLQGSDTLWAKARRIERINKLVT